MESMRCEDGAILRENRRLVQTFLKRNPELDVSDDEAAVRLALMPGVSGKGAEVKRMRTRSEWTNSGFGLYMTSRICRNGGSFLLASGTAAMAMNEHGVRAQLWESPGTAVKLALNTSTLGALSGMLAQFREEAYKFREDLRGEPLTASMASRMLSRDFAPSVVET